MKTNTPFSFFTKLVMLTWLLFFGTFALAYAAEDDAENTAGEIHYGGVSAQSGEEIVVNYRGPSGEEDYTCSLSSGECSDGDELSDKDYFDGKASIVSPDGQHALQVRAFDLPNGPKVYYSLYDVSGEEPDFQALLPFYGLAKDKQFSSDGESIIFATNEGKVLTYDVSSRSMSESSLNGASNDLPFFLFSPSGEYASSYSYSEEAHMIYNLESGETHRVSGNQASYLEIAEDEKYGAYSVNSGDFEAMKVVDFSGEELETTTIADGADGDYDIEDYIFVENKLYYMANKENPITWSIYEYDFENDTETKIADDVSYGEYLKRADSKLLYQVIDGKNANISAYDAATGETTSFEPAGDSPKASGVNREIMTFDSGRTGVLLTPEDEDDQSGDLFVWLHGGPMRQVAVGYHSYLSYGVYDEMLERFVSSGASVLKLDYTGSRGYGNDVEEGLDKKVGVTDVEDVVGATKELQDEYDIDRTFLIGNSYGGYLALRGLNQEQDLFDGAISIAGVTDWYGLISRIPSSPFKKLFHGVPGNDNIDEYMEASIYGRIPDLDDSKKILMVYGEQDDQVPTWQSTEFIEFARKFDVDLESLVFEDEGHVLKKRENLDDLCAKISGQFEIDNVKCEL